MKKPNFFIIGAPKCGTTSLANWLSEHPQIFISRIKEPHFFNFDFAERQYKFLSQYEALFSEAGSQHISIGEATTRYLYSRTAIPAILEYTRNPRFIVMTRNPVDMAYSLHDQTLFMGNENESSFENAWALQKFRIYGDYVPKSCVDPQILLYGKTCKIGEQLKRLFEIVSREQVLVLNLDHIKQDVRQEYQKILDFLNVDDDRRQSFPVLNIAKEKRFPILWRAVRGINRMLFSMGLPRQHIGFTRFIFNIDRKERDRPPLQNAMRQKLNKYFADDISLLEQITGWNLSAWRYRE